jgi:uncharacterized protein (DUF2062 family)
MKKFLKRYIPNSDELKNHKYLGWLSQYLHHSSLWNFNRRSISKAFAVGLFFAFIPVPFQMLLAAPSAIIFSANLPVSITLVWITNPITMLPIFYGCYKLGAWIFGISIEKDFAMSLECVWQAFDTILQPFLFGCLILSIVSSVLGYFSIQLIYRLKAYKRLRRS